MTQYDTFGHDADRNHAPQRDQQFARESHDHGRLACALGAGGSLREPPRQRAVLLKHQEPPRELDDATPYPGIT